MIARIWRKWDQLFRRKRPSGFEVRYAAHTIERLGNDPQACAILADLLDIQTDPGESAASFVADACRRYAGREEIDHLQRRLCQLQANSHGAGVDRG